MKYLQEIAVLALVVIAATSVYEVVKKHHRHNKHQDVKIQHGEYNYWEDLN